MEKSELMATGDNMVTAMRKLAFEISEQVKSANSEDRKKELLKIFIVSISYFIDKYFMEASCSLHAWLDRPLPEIPENGELAKSLKRLEGRLKRMERKSYREKFWLREEKDLNEKRGAPEDLDEEKLRTEIIAERYGRKKEEVFEKCELVRYQLRTDNERRKMGKVREEAEDLISGVLTIFDAIGTLKFAGKAANVAQVVAVEHLLDFIKRVCSVLEVDIKRCGRWRERSHILASVVLSLKERARDLSGVVDAHIFLALQDILLNAELFIVESDNFLKEKERSERNQRELQEVLGKGFKKVVTHLSAIERGVLATNKRLAGIDGRLSGILCVNEKMLQGIEGNGRRLDDISDGIRSMNEKLDSMLTLMCEE